MKLWYDIWADRRPPRARAIVAAAAVVLLASALAASRAFANELVTACGNHPNEVFTPSSAYGIYADQTCPAGASGPIMALDAFGVPYQQGQGAIWQTTAPTGLTIVGANVPSGQIRTNVGAAFHANFYWSGGSHSITQTDSSMALGGFSSSYFGWLLLCANGPCQNQVFLEVGEVDLSVRETAVPTFSGSGLWQASGWVRGSWPFGLSSDSPSGVCLLAASLDGQQIAETTSPSNDPAAWHQCNAGAISSRIDTTKYGQGALPLSALAADAAAVHEYATKSVYVDNQQPTVSLNGPSDVPSTAGTQYVTATASAGPSGVGGISCRLDGGSWQWYGAATAQVPVAEIGTHQVQCVALNNAVDANGTHGQSPVASFALKIGEPTVAAVAFSKVVNKLRCHKVVERVRVPARWVTIRVHGKRVRVREKAHTQKIKVTRCHPRTVRRRITRVVTIRRHGKRVRVKRTRVVRVVLEPRRVFKTRRRVGHGHRATVSGWLGTADGVALAAQTVSVLTAADNGRNHYHVAATATTAADGSWSARLPAGPSRLVSAAYAGSAMTESALAAPVHLIVPARVQLLSVWPRRVPWGGLVRLRGRLRGGYLPPGGALVRLRIGQGSAVTTYGVKTHVRGNGRFRTIYRFGQGQPSVHRAFWFEIASLPMGDYPYAPANSHKLYVTVGGHPHPG